MSAVVTICSLQYIGDHRLPRSDLLPPEPADVPAPTRQGPWQHRRNLIHQECPAWHEVPAPQQPKSTPLNPFAQEVRVQDQIEQPVLGQHVHLAHVYPLILPSTLLSIRLGSLTLLSLLPCRLPSNLAQFIVMEHISQPCPSPYDQRAHHNAGPSCPFQRTSSSVSGNPTADTEPVEGLPSRCRDEDEWVNWAHTWIQDGADNRPIDVVYRVQTEQSFVSNRQCPWREGGRDYFAAGVGPAFGNVEVRTKVRDLEAERVSRDSRQIRQLGGHGEKAVPGAEQAGNFHEKPCEMAIDVEARAYGCLALRIEVGEPLHCGELGQRQLKRQACERRIGDLQRGRIAMTRQSAPSWRDWVAASRQQGSAGSHQSLWRVSCQRREPRARCSYADSIYEIIVRNSIISAG